MAKLYKGEPSGPRDSVRWIKGQNLPKGLIQNKEVQRRYLSPLTGQTQYSEKGSQEDAPEMWQRDPPRPTHPPPDEPSSQDFTQKEALEGKPKSSQPKGTMPGIAPHIDEKSSLGMV